MMPLFFVNYQRWKDTENLRVFPRVSRAARACQGRCPWCPYYWGFGTHITKTHICWNLYPPIIGLGDVKHNGTSIPTLDLAKNNLWNLFFTWFHQKWFHGWENVYRTFPGSPAAKIYGAGYHEPITSPPCQGEVTTNISADFRGCLDYVFYRGTTCERGLHLK